MKNYPLAFVFIVAALRITAIYLVLSRIYTGVLSLVVMPGKMAWAYLGYQLRDATLPIILSLVLWFIARPIAKLVLKDFDDA